MDNNFGPPEIHELHSCNFITADGIIQNPMKSHTPSYLICIPEVLDFMRIHGPKNINAKLLDNTLQALGIQVNYDTRQRTIT